MTRCGHKQPPPVCAHHAIRRHVFANLSTVHVTQQQFRMQDVPKTTEQEEYDMNNSILVSQEMVQGSPMIYRLLSVATVRSWTRRCGELYRDAKSCAGRGKQHIRALYSSAGFGDSKSTNIGIYQR